MKLTARHLDNHTAARDCTAQLPDLLLSTGAMSGPHRRTRPLTVSPLQRLARRVRAALLRRGPL